MLSLGLHEDVTTPAVGVCSEDCRAERGDFLMALRDSGVTSEPLELRASQAGVCSQPERE